MGGGREGGVGFTGGLSYVGSLISGAGGCGGATGATGAGGGGGGGVYCCCTAGIYTTRGFGG